MKNLTSIILSLLFFSTQFTIAQVTEDAISYTSLLSFDNLAKHDDGRKILEKYPFLSEYKPQKSNEYSVQKRELKRMPIGLRFDHDKAAKISYVANQDNGWRFGDQAYTAASCGKHYGKNKEKKGSRYLEQRIYRLEKNTPTSHVDVLFDSPAFLEDFYNVRSIINGEAVIVGSAALFSDRKDDLKKRILFFDNDLNLLLEKSFNSRQKNMYIYNILTDGETYTVFNSSVSGFLKKGDGEAKYEVNIFSETAVNTAMFDLRSQYITIKRTQFDHMVKLNDGSTFMMGNLIYVDANQESNPEKKGNLIYIHLDKTGKLITSKSIPVKAHVEPNLFFHEETIDHVVFAFKNANADGADMILQLNKNNGAIESEFISTSSKGRYVHVDADTKKITHTKRDNTNKKFVFTTMILK